MAKINIEREIWDLQRAAQEMISAVSSSDDWRDRVQNSYETYTSQIEYLLRGLEFDAKSVSSKVENATSVNSQKHKSDLSSYESTLRSI